LEAQAESGAVERAGLEAARAQKSWRCYCDFVAKPGHKCPKCWLMLKHCSCSGMPRAQLRPRVLVVMHHLELGRHLGSNTAKVLFHFGAELIAWGIKDHDERFQELVSQDKAGCVVLFPGAGAVSASELPASAGRSETSFPPRLIIVLDGGWRECKRINDSIDPEIQRCVVTTASREEYGGTRKYGTTDGSRVQTAAAFIALMQELGEDAEQVAALKAGLAHFMSCWEAQIHRSKTWVT